jgi:hypothetical protein
MGDQKRTAYTFTKNPGPYAESMDYLTLFFNKELLKKVIRDKQVRDTQNCRTSAKPVVHLG